MNQQKKTRTEIKHEAIIDGAIREFSAKGFRRTSMDSIAKAAQVSKRTVYTHFNSKDELFAFIVKKMFSITAESTKISYNTHIDIKTQLLCFARAEIELAKGQDYRALVRILLAECIYSPELTLGVIAEIYEKEEDLDLFIKDAIADGKLQTVEATYAATQFKGIIKGIAFWPQVMMNAPSPDGAISEQLAQDAVMMFLSRYAAQTESINTP